jgi:ABC-type amino acid transport substrate-binding protein
MTMKKLILVAVLLLTVSSLLFAQSSTTANISANVNATLSILRTVDLTIGNVNQGGTVTVLSTAATAAAFTVTGATNMATSITIAYPATLTGPASATMTYTPQYPTSNIIGTAAGRAAATPFAAYTGGIATSNATGNLFVWVGGGVTADPAQAAGSYNGTITCTVTQP